MDEKIEGLLSAIIAAVILGMLWLARPMWHWLLMSIYVFPALWESLIAAIVVAGLSYIFWFARREYDLFEITSKERAIAVFFATFFVLLAILGSLGVMYPQCYLSENLETSKITELPDVDASAVRIMPMVVSERYAKDALQYPRFTLGTGDITFINRTPHWSYGLIPDGLVNFFVLKDRGAVYVDMSTSRKNTRIIEKEMQIGEGMAIADWYKWQLYKKRYWVNYEDPYFIPSESEEDLYIVVPVVSYEYHWRFPTLFAVPRWDGVALINSEGKIELLSPEQARENPVLRNQKLYPERLARYYIDSFRYIHGITNRLFYHRDQLEIADVPGQNEQPFLVVTKEGIKWFIACEPFGEAHGVFKIYLVDARTGEIQFYEQPKAAALIGPVKACDYVRKANPIVDWNRMRPVEPIPIVIEGRLYWQVRVIPEDASGIAYTAMVDAETAEVTELKTDKEIKEFLKGEYEVKPEIPEIGKNVTAIIVIREDSKEIQRIQLFQNQTIEVIPVSYQSI